MENIEYICRDIATRRIKIPGELSWIKNYDNDDILNSMPQKLKKEIINSVLILENKKKMVKDNLKNSLGCEASERYWKFLYNVYCNQITKLIDILTFTNFSSLSREYCYDIYNKSLIIKTSITSEDKESKIFEGCYCLGVDLSLDKYNVNSNQNKKNKIIKNMKNKIEENDVYALILLQSRFIMERIKIIAELSELKRKDEEKFNNQEDLDFKLKSMKKTSKIE